VTVSGYVVRSNAAETARAPLRVTWHEPVPEQAPDQPVNEEPADAVAVRVTTVPSR